MSSLLACRRAGDPTSYGSPTVSSKKSSQCPGMPMLGVVGSERGRQPVREGLIHAEQQELTLVLPAAPPELYLRWMAFWREVEQVMLDSPALEEFASSQSAPFMHDPVARFVSNVVVFQITEQARDALARGTEEARPTVSGDSELLRMGVWYAAERGDWLASQLADGKTVAEAIGIRPLEPELVILRKRTFREVAQQLGEAKAHSRTISVRPASPDRSQSIKP